MKFKIQLIAMVYSSLLCFTSPVPAQNILQPQKDSLRQLIEHSEGIDKLRAYNKLYYLYMSEIADDQKMDTLLMLFRQAEAEAIRQGNVKMQGMVYGNTIISHINRNEYDKIIQKAPGFLDFYIRHNQWKFYYQIHMQLITAYNLKGDYKQAAEEAERMFNRAKEQKDKAGMATALYATAITYNVQNRWKEEEDCFRECIRLLWEISGYDNILTQAYAFLCNSLRAQAQYEKILQLVPEYEKAIARFEKAAGKIQPEARGNLYVALMNTYIDSKVYDKAGEYLSKLENIVNNNISKYELARAKALIFQSQGDYCKALAAIDSAAIEVRESNFDLNATRRIKMEILARMGRTDEAFVLFDKIIAANDTIKNVEINARFDELRTQYEVEKHIAEKERNRNYFLFALSGCLLLVILLGITFYYNRIITRKNLGLYKQIKEQDRLEEEIALLQIRYSADKIVGEEITNLPGDRQQRELVGRLQKYLLTDDNLSKDINRNEITIALGTNKNTLNEAIKAVKGMTAMEYMRAMRIEKARKMIDKHTELTIEAIAYSCGFNTQSTFYRIFRKQYGIGPAEYRKMAESCTS